MNEIRLSNTEFKALASETRTSIIKLLNERNYTLSEISKKMSLAAPTVKQHIGILEGADLIRQIDEGRKWKYYTLTKKGQDILEPKAHSNVLILLGLSIIGVTAVFYNILTLLSAGTMASASPVRDVVKNSILSGETATGAVADPIVREGIDATTQNVGAVLQTFPFANTVAMAISAIAFVAIILIVMRKR